MKKNSTNPQVFLLMPGSGSLHAIFLPRQKRQARNSFFSGVSFLLGGKELRPTDGDGAEFSRNSVGGGVDRQGVTGNSDISDASGL